MSISSGGVVNFSARPTFAASLTIQDGGNLTGGTITMNNGNYLQITCPVQLVLKHIKNSSIVNGIKPNVIKLEY